MQWFAEAKNDRHTPSWILQKAHWQSRSLIFPPPSGRVEEGKRREMREMVSARLWDVSEAAIKAFERKKPLFEQEVPASSEGFLFDLK